MYDILSIALLCFDTYSISLSFYNCDFNTLIFLSKFSLQCEKKEETALIFFGNIIAADKNNSFSQNR